MDKVPIYLCCWHVLKDGTKKIKDVEVRRGILQDLHDVIYMSISHEETIDDFKKRGRVPMRESLHKHRPGDAWTNDFWTYYHQFGK
jgi:polyphosphate kinase 2 (PPK2 family)